MPSPTSVTPSATRRGIGRFFQWNVPLTVCREPAVEVDTAGPLR